jgi:hypothetical protein
MFRRGNAWFVQEKVNPNQTQLMCAVPGNHPPLVLGQGRAEPASSPGKTQFHS